MTDPVLWLEEPEDHDYPAAADFLSLLLSAEACFGILADLREQTTTSYKAKDILRASGLDLLPPDNFHVRRDMRKVRDGHALSPVLLVRGRPLIIADGYHRVCAVYHLSEDADIPGRITDTGY